MATVDVLVTGHVEETDAGDSVHPTISLVRDGDLVLVADPGILSDPSLLTIALQSHGLTVADFVIPGHGPAFRPTEARGDTP